MTSQARIRPSATAALGSASATALCAVLAVLAVGAALAQPAPAFDLPAPRQPLGAPIRLWATYYHIHSAPEFSGGVPYRDATGRAITPPVAPREWCQGSIEGTVQVVSRQGVKTTVNHAGAGQQVFVDCAGLMGINAQQQPWIHATSRAYFAPARGEYGDGVTGYKLVPGRSLATTDARLPPGTALYLPAARGAPLQLPGGRTVAHDGYFLVADTGHAVKPGQLDTFCGEFAGNCLPAIIGNDPASTFDAHRVTDPAVTGLLRALHAH